MPTSSRPTALLAPIGRGDHTLPPGIAPQFMKKPCHCEGAPRPRQSVPPALQKEVTLRPPLNFCLRGGAYSSSSWPTRAICNSSSCFCTPHKMAEHFAGSPRIDFNPRRKRIPPAARFCCAKRLVWSKSSGKKSAWEELTPPPAGPPEQYAIRPIAFAPRWTVRPS